MFYKTIVLIKVLFFALNQIQTTDCLFVSIGDYRGYEGINRIDCGLRFKPEIHYISRSNKCFPKGIESVRLMVFPVHQTRFITKVDPIQSRVYNGRDEWLGESPWTVRLFMTFRRDAFGKVETYTDVCSGSLVTYEWVLTAAHCIDRSNSEVLSIEVFAGIRNAKNIVHLKKLFYHPGWSKPTGVEAKAEHDIALLKLEKKYKQDYQRGNHYGINTICLPNKSSLNANKENATFAGWGAINSRDNLPKRLQIAEAVLKEHRFCGTANLCANFVGNQPRTCKGDSGGPLYQFNNDKTPRAVQIGVTRSGGDCQQGKGWTHWVPVMSFIPWILDVIKNY